MLMTRFAVRGNLRPGATFVPLNDLPERQYANTAANADLLADLASDRKAGTPLLANLFKAIADYFVDDVMSGLDADAIDAETLTQLRLAVWHRALYGNGVLMSLERGQIVAVSPRFWWPLLEGPIRVGSVVVLPFSTESTIGLTGGANLPNRAIAAEVLDSDQGGRLYNAPYSGVTLGTNGWRSTELASLVVSPFGDGRSDFTGAAPLIESINANLRSGDSIINRHAQPHIQVPASSITYDDDGNPSLPVNKEGSVFPVQRDDKDVQFVTLTADPRLLQWQVETELSLLASIVSMPVSAFNVSSLRRLESAESIEELAKPGNDKVLTWRHDLARAASRVGLDLSFPVDDNDDSREQEDSDNVG